MKKYTYKFLSELMYCSCAVVIVGFVGLILESIGKDFNLQNTTLLGSTVWLLSLIFGLCSYIVLIVGYFMKSNYKRKVKKVKKNEQD